MFENSMIQKWKKDVAKVHDEFVRDIVQWYPDRVKAKRVAYLVEQICKLTDEALYWHDVYSIFPKWLREAGVDQVINPLEKKIHDMRLEIEQYNEPKVIKEIISQEDIARAHEADCKDFVEVKKRAGNISKAICPFHEDTNPSLCLYQGEKGFHCFSCGAHGDAIALVQFLKGCGFVEAVKFINHI